ncbi:MAG: tyrosine-protein phosphatase [Proteobacteria bacterium]|nr:tyrosine-protein phosphatase [Pseudomonadota bacterium]
MGDVCKYSFPGYQIWLAFIPNPLSQALFQYTVIPGQIYRSAQPDIEDITRWSEQLRIRSVLTLQSATPWSPEQAGQIGSLGIDLFFVPLKFDRQPSRASMIKLLELIHNAPKPLLVHCLRGVDRSGLVSAMAWRTAARSFVTG